MNANFEKTNLDNAEMLVKTVDIAERYNKPLDAAMKIPPIDFSKLPVVTPMALEVIKTIELIFLNKNGTPKKMNLWNKISMGFKALKALVIIGNIIGILFPKK